MKTLDKTRVINVLHELEEAMKQEFKPTKKGDSFGPSCELFAKVLLTSRVRHLLLDERGVYYGLEIRSFMTALTVSSVRRIIGSK